MIPFFPLELVVYPGERLPLHIFEDRYRQLINDCTEDGITFGIPTYINKRLEYGTEVKLQKVAKKYPGGESDIICVGYRVFRILDFYHHVTGKLYAGGEVEFLTNEDDGKLELQEELLRNIAALYIELAVDNPPVYTIPFVSYQVAHKIGLSLSQEYHLLKLRSELARLKYLMNHIKATLPVVRAMNRAKRVIKMNGHFRNYDPLDFEDFKV